MYQVFVYGTLKEGFPNYGINKGIRLTGTFITKNRYPLYLVGDRYSPWLVLDVGSGHHVKGQVFSVDEPTLRDMDKLERITEFDGYRRVELSVVSLDSNEEFIVFTYGKPVNQLNGAQLQSDPLDEYKIEHSSLYRRRNP